MGTKPSYKHIEGERYAVSLGKDTTCIAEISPFQIDSLDNQIGNTPLEPIDLVIEGNIRKVHLKLEGANPVGSVKDRTGYALVRDLEERGLLHKESVVIESTSGNLGVALAYICRAKGYPFLAIVDPKATQENLAKMQAMGAMVEMVHQLDANGGYLLSRLARVQELCQLSDKYVWTNQYANAANPLIHYTTTAPEIYHQLHEHVDAVFVAVSTGGTLAGISRFFREVSPTTHIIGVDARGSVVFGAQPGPRKLTGIGSSRPSSFLTAGMYDAHLLVSDEEAFAFCHALSAATGIKVGGSSGAVLAACANYLQVHPELGNVVCMCSDGGENYASSIFNEQWLQHHGLTLSEDHLRPVQSIRHTKAIHQ